MVDCGNTTEVKGHNITELNVLLKYLNALIYRDIPDLYLNKNGIDSC